MKSHDFGQHLYNSRQLSEVQMARMIGAAKHAEPTLAIEALFLQLISAEELTDIFRSMIRSIGTTLRLTDDRVRSLITARQALRAEQLKDGQSIRFAQALLDNGLANFLKLERILDEYHNLQVPPLEAMMTIYYEKWRDRFALDFPFAIDLMRNLHMFLSDALKATVIILPPPSIDCRGMRGASVKLCGDVSAVTSIFADERTFEKLAASYDEWVESTEDAFDAMAELLNVFVGHFAVKAATQRGIDVEPEPPRIGTLSETPDGFLMMTDVGKFFIAIDREEIIRNS